MNIVKDEPESFWHSEPELKALVEEATAKDDGKWLFVYPVGDAFTNTEELNKHFAISFSVLPGEFGALTYSIVGNSTKADDVESAKAFIKTFLYR